MATAKLLSLPTTAPKGLSETNLRYQANGVKSVANASYAMAATDYSVVITSLSSAITITLPLSTLIDPNQRFSIIDASGSCSTTNTITVVPYTATGTDTVAGSSAGVVLTSPYQWLDFTSPVANLWVFK